MGPPTEPPSLASAASYDETPYPSHAITETHPGRMAAIAALLGIPTTDVAHARVLELGCARGGNLLPMAASLPDATFIGVDLSPVQIAEAEDRRRDAGLTNARFLVADLGNLPDDLGTFDFIVCHGVLSWVPEETQRAVFRVLAERLTPAGVGFVSYNVLPGFRLRQITRDLLRFYASDPALEATPPLGRLAVALEKLREVGGLDHESTFHLALREEAANLARCSPAYVLHEHLEDTNTPLSFTEFARAADEHGLAWLAECPLHRTWPDDARGRGSLDLVGDRRSREAVLRGQSEVDLRLGRPFRRSLVVRREALPAAEGGFQLQATRAADLWVRSPPATMTPGAPFAAAPYLDDVWPRGMTPRMLADALGSTASVADVSQAMVDLVATTRSLELLAFQPPVATAAEAGDRPVVPAFARRCLAETGIADNLFHEEVRADDPWLRRAVVLFDGTHTIDDVVDALARDPSLVQTGNRGSVLPRVNEILAFLGRASLLMSTAGTRSADRCG